MSSKNRKKLSAIGATGTIETVRGFGYRKRFRTHRRRFGRASHRRAKTADDSAAIADVAPNPTIARQIRDRRSRFHDRPHCDRSQGHVKLRLTRPAPVARFRE